MFGFFSTQYFATKGFWIPYKVDLDGNEFKTDKYSPRYDLWGTKCLQKTTAIEDGTNISNSSQSFFRKFIWTGFW